VLQSLNPKFPQFLKEYELTNIKFDASCFHIIHNEQGKPLDDIRSKSDNIAAANQINEIVRKLTNDPECALHVSIAGGRKTMGYYLGYSLSLWGRVQDGLSHVLVSEEFESHPEFWFPTKSSHIIYSRNNKPLDTKNAEVTLADIPFVRLRGELPHKSLINKHTFNEVVKQLQPIKNKKILFDYQNKYVCIGDNKIDLEASLLAFYGWLARKKSDSNGGVIIPVEQAPEMEYAESYIKEYKIIVGDFNAENSRTVRALEKGMDKSFFEQKKSKLLKLLRDNIGQRNLADFGITYHKVNGINYHQVTIEAGNISWARHKKWSDNG